MLRHEALMRVYPLADAVQFTLYLCQEPGTRAYFIRGHGKFKLPVNSTINHELMCKVVSSGVREDGAYIIMAISGRVYVLLSYDDGMKQLTFTVLDGDAGVDVSNLSHLSLKGLYDRCLSVARGMWTREERGERWSRLDAVEVVDTSAVGSDQEAGGADYRVGQDTC